MKMNLDRFESEALRPEILGTNKSKLGGDLISLNHHDLKLKECSARGLNLRSLMINMLDSRIMKEWRF